MRVTWIFGMLMLMTSLTGAGEVSKPLFPAVKDLPDRMEGPDA
jgi:hypothetical protein